MNEPIYHAILIPGGGVGGDAAPQPWVRRRLDRAVELHDGGLLICLSAGTTHKPPPRDAEGFPVFESVASAEYLIRRGIDRRKLLVETCSYDTIGNAYFSRVIHCEPRRLHRLLVITSEFHMPRTQAVFDWVYGLPSEGQSGWPPFCLAYEEVPDEGIDPDALRRRIAREQDALRQAGELSLRVKTLEALHEWLFTDHAAYAAGLKPDRASGRELETY
jgi:hypothetical protein